MTQWDNSEAKTTTEKPSEWSDWDEMEHALGSVLNYMHAIDKEIGRRDKKMVLHLYQSMRHHLGVFFQYVIDLDREKIANGTPYVEWGRLKDHWSDCPVEDCVSDKGDPDEDCYVCNGDGRVFWGSFYRQDTGQCHGCNDERGVSEFGPHEWLCVDCYIRSHKNQCGCDLWRRWE